MTSLPVPSEYEEQLAFIEWLEYQDVVFTAIPNSTYTPSMKQKMMNRRMGLRPGLPDVVIAIPNIGLLFVEMKKQRGGTVSQYQKDWIETLNTIPGIEARVCKGATEAINFVAEFVPAAKNSQAIF